MLRTNYQSHASTLLDASCSGQWARVGKFIAKPCRFGLTEGRQSKCWLAVGCRLWIRRETEDRFSLPTSRAVTWKQIGETHSWRHLAHPARYIDFSPKCRRSGDGVDPALGHVVGELQAKVAAGMYRGKHFGSWPIRRVKIALEVIFEIVSPFHFFKDDSNECRQRLERWRGDLFMVCWCASTIIMFIFSRAKVGDQIRRTTGDHDGIVLTMCSRIIHCCSICQPITTVQWINCNKLSMARCCRAWCLMLW